MYLRYSSGITFDLLTAFGLTLREPAYVRRLYVYFQSLLGGETQNFVKGSARFFSFRTHHTSCASCEHLAIGGGGVPAASDPVRLLRAAAARDHVSSLSVWHSPLPRFLPVCRSCCRTFQVSAFGPPRSSSRQAARSFRRLRALPRNGARTAGRACWLHGRRRHVGWRAASRPTSARRAAG